MPARPGAAAVGVDGRRAAHATASALMLLGALLAVSATLLVLVSAPAGASLLLLASSLVATGFTASLLLG